MVLKIDEHTDIIIGIDHVGIFPAIITPPFFNELILLLLRFS